MPVFFNSAPAYAVNMRQMTVIAAMSAARNGHGSFSVMQRFTASSR